MAPMYCRMKAPGLRSFVAKSPDCPFAGLVVMARLAWVRLEGGWRWEESKEGVQSKRGLFLKSRRVGLAVGTYMVGHRYGRDFDEG